MKSCEKLNLAANKDAGQNIAMDEWESTISDGIEEDLGGLFGRMEGTMHVVGDIVASIDVVWNADS